MVYPGDIASDSSCKLMSTVYVFGGVEVVEEPVSKKTV